MMKHSLELEARVGVKLGGLLTWAFTFPGTPYFAGYRALATNGINLPVMSAFKLLGRLDGTRLPLTSTGARPLDDILANGLRDQPDVDGMATLNGGAVQVLVWNYHDDLVTTPATPVHLAITLPAGFGPRARVSHLRVDESHGDAYTVWVSQGMPANPSADQVAALQQAMEPAAVTADRILGVTAGRPISVDFDLPRFGVSLLTVVPDSSDAGLDTGVSGGPHGGGCSCHVDDRAGRLADLLAVAFLALGVARRRPRAI
jgi:xylan 1,4-beta-xylosidase